ncbi:MAG: response regulator, partial [Lentisphaeria bacterium]|nr:response regulator [Lentisphaeria bacterium]
QNNGFVYAYSEPGKGTTFKIYLPEVAAEVANMSAAGETATPRGRGETILLVEDDQSVRATCSMFLKSLGYRVLAAAEPREALKAVAAHPADIALLLTDVVMPGMDGRQLAQRIRAVKPGVKVLFMSGYTADVIAQRGVLERDVVFIGKPFACDELARKLREILPMAVPSSSPPGCGGSAGIGCGPRSQSRN